MKFRILIHKKAYEFLKDLKSEERQRIVDKLKRLEDSRQLDLTLLRLQAKQTPSDYAMEKIIVVAKIDVRKRIYQQTPKNH